MTSSFPSVPTPAFESTASSESASCGAARADERHEFFLASQKETEAFAALLAETARPGTCFALTGEMGAGKSTFARAFLRALADDPSLEVPSPTFALVQHYETQSGPAYHYDLWRLDGPESLYELDWDEACAGIMLVEWPQRAAESLPENALFLAFSEVDFSEAPDSDSDSAPGPVSKLEPELPALENELGCVPNERRFVRLSGWPENVTLPDFVQARTVGKAL